ncbi:hypothetical protein, partial [Bradyrhizobium sp. Ai1a-2]|uniref:hypothetical protein n=1 Tax=Bradyrhizobium sp. Ai1a-2 TaxID=196490 RepID=UPI0005B7B3D4
MALKALKDEKDIAAVPLDEPVMIELPMGVDDAGGDIEPGDKKKPAKVERRDDGSKTLEEQLEAALEAQKKDRERADRAERERAQAERVANQRAAEVEEARKRSNALESDVISGGLKAAQNELAAAKAELVRAGEAGDYTAMGEANSRIARAQSQIVNLEGGAAEIEERKTVEKRTEPQQQQRQLSWSESVQRNPNLMTVEKDWMIQHEADFRDADFNRKLEAAYQGALGKGLVRGSDEYFDHIERATGLKNERRQERDDNDEREVNVSAPVSRSERRGDGSFVSRSSTVTLTPAQREMAHNMGLTDVEYA